jgi:hypothetical protein
LVNPQETKAFVVNIARALTARFDMMNISAILQDEVITQGFGK